MSAPVSASRLRHRLVLQHPVFSRDEIGGTVVTWHNTASIWGSIEPLRQNARWTGQKMQDHRFVKIFVRYRDDITTSARLVKGERQFLVQSVLNADEENHTLELLCEEIS